MAVLAVERRVDRLELLMAELTANVNRLSIEMREFKQEMREFKQEMREFKQEMRDFKQEMSEFKTQSQAQIRDMNRQWGNLANRLGTLAEDLVAPSVPRILRDLVGCTEEQRPFWSVRSIRYSAVSKEGREFDVVAGCGDVLLINETKTRLDSHDVNDFVSLLQRAREFFPEYASYKIVGALASFYVDPTLVTYGERQGLIMLGMADDVMSILNTDKLTLHWF